MKTGKISININGDLPDAELIRRAVIAEKTVKRVWIGELEFFKDPLEVAKLVEDNSSLEVCILLSPSRRGCKEINRIAKKYPVGLIPGKSRNLSTFISCLENVRKVSNELYVGCSGKRIAEVACKLSDGILANYVYPEYIEWLGDFNFIAAFGPSLVLPSEFYEDLLMAAAIVMGSNASFIEYFNLVDIQKELSSVNFEKLVKARQKGESVSTLDDFRTIEKHKNLLLERFTVSGGIKDVVKKLQNLLNACNHVVLGDPFFRDLKAMEKLPEIAVEVK